VDRYLVAVLGPHPLQGMAKICPLRESAEELGLGQGECAMLRIQQTEERGSLEFPVWEIRVVGKDIRVTIFDVEQTDHKLLSELLDRLSRMIYLDYD